MPAVGAREWQCLHGGRRGTRPGNRRRAARGTPTPWSAAESGNEMGFKFPIRDSIMIGDSLPVSRPNREWGEWKERELGASRRVCGGAGSAVADFDSESGIMIHDPAARVNRMCPASHTRSDKTAAC